MADSRHTRVELVDGALIQRTRNGTQKRLAAQSSITRLVLLSAADAARLAGRDGTEEGALVAFVGEEPVALILVADWAPPAPATGRDLLVTTGIVDLAAELGLPIEPVTQTDLASWQPEPLRGVLLRPVVEVAWPGTNARWLCLLGIAAAVVSWALATTAVGALLAAVALTAVGAVVLGIRRGRAAAALHSVFTPPPGASVVNASPEAGKPRGLTGHALALSRGDVVVRRLDGEVWLAGPELDGVSQVVAEPQHLRLRARGHDVAVLQTAVWCSAPDARATLLRACAEGGLEVLESPVDTVLVRDKGDFLDKDARPSRLQTTRESGDPTLTSPFLSGVGAWLVLVSSLLSMAFNLLVGALLTACAIVLVAESTRLAVVRALADRRALRPMERLS